MNAPAPRPALRKAADAHIHPAAPGHTAHSLRQASEPTAGTAPALPVPREDVESKAGSTSSKGADPGKAIPHRLSGPLGGTTSDSLRPNAKASRGRGRARPPEKLVEITFKVPKTVRRDFRAAVKADKKDPDEVATALLSAWLHG